MAYLKRYPQAHLAIALATLVACWATTAEAQFFRQGAVGGVNVDVDGVLSNPEVSELRELQETWQAGLDDVPADLDAAAEMRFVSLRQIEEQIAAARERGEEPGDAVRYLAGLQRIQYVLVYPERRDIVLAGPAEGWRVDSLGNVVGATTGRPVLLLDDLMVALRVAESANRTGISCSIDPTPEGLQRWQQLPPPRAAGQGSQAAELRARQIEEALGPQRITVTGVPDSSHFARVIVAADFRMKRLAMDFERAPVDGMPSFLQLVGRRGRMSNMMPRWWLAPSYEPLRRDAEGLAWELRGQGVKCLTEQDFFAADGSRQQTGQADPLAQQWADRFTEKFDELAHEISTFGQLRNVMDLAVVAALLSKEGLLAHSGLEIPHLLSQEPLEEYHAPRRVPSQASFVRAGRNWVISVSGGVQIFPWQVAERTEVAPELAGARETEPASSEAWYWQR